MYRLPFILLFCFIFSFDNNAEILESMFNESAWKEVNKHSDSLMVYKKEIKGSPIPAFKASMISKVPMIYIIEAVLDGENHEEFMGSSHVIESEFVGTKSRDTTYCYQMLDLPFISDRHYITTNFNDTISVDNHYRLNWMVDNKKNHADFTTFIDKKNEIHGDPIFISDGIGSWEIKRAGNNTTQINYYVLIDPGGWIPNAVVSYVNKSLGPDTVIMMVKEGGRRFKADDTPHHILFSLNPEYSNLNIDTTTGKYIVNNNLDIQILINAYGIVSIERWLPNADSSDKDGDINLSKVYRLDIGPRRGDEIETIKQRVADLPCVLNVEIQYSRQYLKKRLK